MKFKCGGEALGFLVLVLGAALTVSISSVGVQGQTTVAPSCTVARCRSACDSYWTPDEGCLGKTCRVRCYDECQSNPCSSPAAAAAAFVPLVGAPSNNDDCVFSCMATHESCTDACDARPNPTIDCGMACDAASGACIDKCKANVKATTTIKKDGKAASQTTVAPSCLASCASAAATAQLVCKLKARSKHEQCEGQLAQVLETCQTTCSAAAAASKTATRLTTVTLAPNDSPVPHFWQCNNGGIPSAGCARDFQVHNAKCFTQCAGTTGDARAVCLSRCEPDDYWSERCEVACRQCFNACALGDHTCEQACVNLGMSPYSTNSPSTTPVAPLADGPNDYYECRRFIEEISVCQETSFLRSTLDACRRNVGQKHPGLGEKCRCRKCEPLIPDDCSGC